MNSKFSFSSITFRASLDESTYELKALENVLMSYGAKPSELYSTECIQYRPRILQHFCYNPFVWTSKGVLTLNATENTINYKVSYPFPMAIFGTILLGVLLYQINPMFFAFLSIPIRYVACIYFMQRDIFKRMLKANESNSYLSAAKREMNP